MSAMLKDFTQILKLKFINFKLMIKEIYNIIINFLKLNTF